MAQRQRTARTRTGTKKPSRTRSSKKSTESNESFDIVTRNLAAQYRPKVLEDYVGQEASVKKICFVIVIEDNPEVERYNFAGNIKISIIAPAR